MWINFTASNITGLSPTEIVQVDRLTDVANLPSIVAQVVREVRGYIGRGNPIGLDGTIPDELQTAANAMVVYRYVSQIPSGSLMSEARKTAYEDAQRQLRATAKGEFLIQLPDTYNPKQPGGDSFEIARVRPRRATDRHTSGLT